MLLLWLSQLLFLLCFLVFHYNHGLQRLEMPLSEFWHWNSGNNCRELCILVSTVVFIQSFFWSFSSFIVISSYLAQVQFSNTSRIIRVFVNFILIQIEWGTLRCFTYILFAWELCFRPSAYRIFHHYEVYKQIRTLLFLLGLYIRFP